MFSDFRIMWQDKTVLAVVPARGGSKGIPRKNLCKVGNRSLIGWAAHVTQQLPWIDLAVLSTDDPELAEEGRQYGLQVPFLRPCELATDTALGIDVWRHAWLEAEKWQSKSFDLGLYLQPTTPLRQPEDIVRTVETLVLGPYKAATTIAPVPGHFIPEKILTLEDNGCVTPYLPGQAVSNRQQAKNYYYRTGACYAAWRNTIVSERTLIEADCAGVIIESFTPNIDDPIELEFANFLLQKASRE